MWALGMVIFALAASAVSLYYYLQVLKRVYVTPGTTDEPMAASALEQLVLLLIALAVVLLGIFPSALSGWIPLG